MRPSRVLAPVLSMVLVVGSAAAAGQQPSQDASFEVVSIRQGSPDVPRRGRQPEYEIAADGWKLNNAPLLFALINAYTPTAGGHIFYDPGQMKGVPGWVMDTRYQIDAKIGEVYVERWRDPAAQAELLHGMVRSMLAERCKLVVHRESKEIAIYSLVLAKDGPKFKKTDPEEQHPGGIPVPGGTGTVVMEGPAAMHFYGVNLNAVATVLSNFTDRPVQDATGLAGRYDLALSRPAMNPEDAGSSLSSMLADLGLKMVPAKGVVETLVIDHIEKPSEN